MFILDGEHLPEGLEQVPPGRYILEAIGDETPLSSDAEEGIFDALRQIDAGEGRSLHEVIEDIRGKASAG